jgi:hypothetical protein
MRVGLAASHAYKSSAWELNSEACVRCIVSIHPRGVV